MASVYKRSSDRKRKGSPYYITYTDHTGKRRNQKGFTDKATTEQLAAKLDHEVMLRKRGLIDPVQEAFALNRGCAIDKHVDEFERHLKVRQTTEKHVKLTLSRVRRVIAECEVTSLIDFSKEKIEITLSEMQTEDDSANRTFNHYVQALDSFGRWLAESHRVAANPFVGLTRRNTEIDIRHKRRALSFEEMTKLIGAAIASPRLIQGYTGPERAGAYYFSYMTGLRRKEMASLTARNFDLDGTPPTVRLDAACSKHRREDVLPLHPQLVADLRLWLQDLQPDQPLFPRLDRKKTWLMVKKDLATAGIEYVTEDGIADFHAAGRHSHVTELFRAGGTPTEVRQLARHSDIRMTMRYTHVGIKDQARALASLEAPTNGRCAGAPVVESQHRISTATADFSGHSEAASGGAGPTNGEVHKSVKPGGAGLSDAQSHPQAAGDSETKEWRRRESNPRSTPT